MTSESENKEVKIPIYSKWAVLGFCVFFSPIFGGFMLRQNLKDKGYPKEGLLVLMVSFGMAALTALLSTTMLRGPGTTFLANFLQGALMVEIVYRKFFPDEDLYPKKGIGKPLTISLIVVCLMLLILIASGVPLSSI